MSDLDPRWEWTELNRLCSTEPTYIRGRCNHLETTPVLSRDSLERELDWPHGEVVAHLCLTCASQLPAEWISEQHGYSNGYIQPVSES